jgi:hypothetical protein
MDRDSISKPVDNCPSAIGTLDFRGLGVVLFGCGADGLPPDQRRDAMGSLGRALPSRLQALDETRLRRNGLKSSPSELPVPQQANRKQTNPHGVTHSRAVLIPGTPGVRSNCSRPSSAPAMRVKAESAPSRRKWEQGGERGTSQGAMHRKGTEYARREAFPWLGTEEAGPSDTSSGRKGLARLSNRTGWYAA